MRGMLVTGEAATAEKRRRLRDIDILRDRDFHFLIKVLQGCRKCDIAKEYRISVRLLNRRLSKIPAHVRAHVGRLVADYAPEGNGFVPDSALDRARQMMKPKRDDTQRDIDGECLD